MKITGALWLAADGTQRVLATLTEAGHQALAVGGCVRNQLIGAPVDDVDIATDAVPERVIAVVEAAGLKPVPTGIDHGTVTVVVEGEGYEVTTFRKDVDTDGRHATVAFSDRIEEDAARRDFTMNALYADATGTVLDPLGGLPDLHARRVRFIGDAEQRIREDYLRILRYFRFHAWYGNPEHGVDAEALAACATLAEGLEQLSAERVGAETLKLLSAPDPAPAVSSMAQSGILVRILPGADPGLLAVLVHLEGTLDAAPDPLRRLAMLGRDEAPERLRLSRKQAARLALLRDGIGAEAGTAELAWRHGADTARDIELLRAASFSAPLPADLGDRIARGATARFPVRGADLAGDYEGPEIGRKLAELERRWIASGMTASRDDLLG